MVNKKEKKEILFEKFSKNLEFVKKDPSINFSLSKNNGFICPICFKMFDRQGLSNIYDDQLTLEDVPPKSLGGRIKTLTCKICNNKGGRELESHLKTKLEFFEFIKGIPNSRLNATFAVNKRISLNGTIESKKRNEFEIIFDNNRSNPIEIKKIEKVFKKGFMPDIDLKIFSSYKNQNANIALIRIAYLEAFCFFGYGFLINNNLEFIRNQIINPEKKILPHTGIILNDFSDEYLGISIVNEPKDLCAFLIVFKLKTRKKDYNYGVLLPGPSDPGFRIYENLKKRKLANKINRIHYAMKLLPKKNYLEDENLCFASYKFWNKFL